MLEMTRPNIFICLLLDPLILLMVVTLLAASAAGYVFYERCAFDAALFLAVVGGVMICSRGMMLQDQVKRILNGMKLQPCYTGVFWKWSLLMLWGMIIVGPFTEKGDTEYVWAKRVLNEHRAKLEKDFGNVRPVNEMAHTRAKALELANQVDLAKREGHYPTFCRSSVVMWRKRK